MNRSSSMQLVPATTTAVAAIVRLPLGELERKGPLPGSPSKEQDKGKDR